MSTTSAQRFLQQKRIPFEAREYDHRVKGAEFAAESLGWPVESMVKTLVVSLADGSFCLCLMPGHLELSLKTLAREAAVKSARMATQEEAERLTGYLVGGISPFGTRRSFAVWMHATIPGFETIGINGGRRGLIVFLDPKKAQEALGAKVADLAT